MSIVKDLCLVAMFLFLIIKYLLLYRDMLKQREYFVETLSHDLRVSTIAQIRGLELLEKQLSQDRNEDLIREIRNTSKFSLSLVFIVKS